MSVDLAMENGNGFLGGAAHPNPLQRRPHVALLTVPGIGHVTPVAELAKLLFAHHGFSVTLITLAASTSKAHSALLASLPPAISCLTLPPVSLDDLPASTRIETIMSVSASRSVPHLRSALSQLQQSANLVALVADLFATDAISVARDLGIPPYIFFTSNLLLLSLLLHLPEIDATTTCEYRDLPEPLRLPGCVPIPGPDILDTLHDRANDAYRWMVNHGRRFLEVDGILVNSFEAFEPVPTKVFREPCPGRPPVYLVGPLTKSGTTKEEGETECLRWLDQQPPGSVLFVSFGSGGTLSIAQTVELAMGLELSGQRYLWVIRSPTNSGDVSEAYFTTESRSDPFQFLPTGFVERTRDVGLLVPSWAPQVAVLNHAATGGFLSHCGWNSALESVKAGVPMVAWPLFAEQRQNAVMLSEGEGGAGIALRPRAEREGGIVRREEVAWVVRELMEGDEGKAARLRVAELQEAAARALEEGGSVCKSLAEVASRWRASNR